MPVRRRPPLWQALALQAPALQALVLQALVLQALVLQALVLQALALPALLVACSDPPEPPPAAPPPDLPRWSQALHVRWAGPTTALAGPLAVVVDVPGGPLDRIVADPDVTTFLNDRFTPLFLVPQAAPELPAPSLQVLDAQGCWLLTPQLPADTAAFIAAGNTVMRAVHQGRRPLPRPDPPALAGLALPPGHPLRQVCVAP